MKISMLYICTGKYELFWDDFYKTCEQWFYPNIEKEYFVFSDSPRILKLNSGNIHVFYQKKTGWPYDTLLRYNWICTVQDLVLKTDFAYFVNANSRFIRKIDESVIPLPSEERPLVLSIHPIDYDDTTGKSANPERNPISTACVDIGTPCRAHCGAFWGGTSKDVINMCRELRNRVAIDLGNNFIAVWHDQSHLIKYATEHKHYDIPNGLVSYEEYANLDTCCLMFPSKDNFGGNDKLREVSTKVRMQHMPRKVYSKMLKIATKLKCDKALRTAVNLFKRNRQM